VSLRIFLGPYQSAMGDMIKRNDINMLDHLFSVAPMMDGTENLVVSIG
jgi:hypothetical protein